LIALSLFKVRRFLSTGLRLRTACDLEIKGELLVTRPEGFTIPSENDLLTECKALIVKCKSMFADPPVTTVEWRQVKGKTKKGDSREVSGEESEE
jgi:CRISPR-associated protein Csb1